MKSSLALLFLFLLWVPSMCLTADPSCGPWNEEREILISFFISTSGCSWTNSSGWLQAFSDHCQWFGIYCNSLHQITKVSLNYNGLSGTLPPLLEKLQHLETLELKGNSLRGEVPESLGELLNLRLVDLSQNYYETISENFHFPEQSSLEHLDLSQNKLTKLPKMLTMTETQSFRVLKVSKNSLVELPSEIGNLKNLTTLDVSMNKNLKLPDEIWSLVNLEDFLINGIGLNVLSSQIGNLKQLRTLDVGSNKLQKIPDEIKLLEQLEALHIGNNELTELPSSLLDQLGNLQILNIYINNLTAIETLHSSSVWYIDAGTNPFPEMDVTYLTNLTELRITAKIIPYVLPSTIQSLGLYSSVEPELPLLSSSLQTLEFWAVTLKEWPSILSTTDLSSLRAFRSITPISSLSFPSWVLELPNLEILYLQNLKGTLSSEIGLLTSLQELVISDSPELEGSLPTQIGMLKNLKRLTIKSCPRLSGTIPEALTSLENLNTLVIQNTNFTGTLGVEFRKLNQIQDCSFGSQSTHNLRCEAQNLFGDRVCDIACEGQSLEGVWRFELDGCRDMSQGGWIGLKRSDLIINSDNTFQMSSEFLFRCQEPFYFTVSGEMKVLEQVQVDQDLYQVDLSFTLNTKEVLAVTQSWVTPFSAVCSFPLNVAEDTDISGLDCQPFLTNIVLKPIELCPTETVSALVNFKNRLLWSDHLSLVVLPCTLLPNESFSDVWQNGGWNCTTSNVPFECKPICGDGQRLEVEECDDGNKQTKDGCSETCHVENGWICSNEEFESTQCEPVCGDGLVVDVHDCDLEENDQTGFPAGFIALVVVGSVLIVGGAILALYYRQRKQLSTFEILADELELGDVLGEGKFGKVHKATWRKTTVVAVKVLKMTDLDDSKLQEFIDEARLFSQLPPHPNIVQFLGITLPRQSGKRTLGRISGETEETFQNARIITEYLPNGNLIRWFNGITVEDQLLSLELNLQLAKGITAGMDHLHKNKIIHRDLAARNVLIHITINETVNMSSSSGKDTKVQVVPKISDFGLSGTVKKNSLVAIRWASPEILKDGAHKSTEKSDVWAFGVLLYEILVRCAHQPYMSLPNEQVIERVLCGKVLEPPPDCHIMFADVMRSCLNTSIHLRPSFESLFQTLSWEESQISELGIKDDTLNQKPPKDHIEVYSDLSTETNYMAVSSTYGVV